MSPLENPFGNFFKPKNRPEVKIISREPLQPPSRDIDAEIKIISTDSLQPAVPQAEPLIEPPSIDEHAIYMRNQELAAKGQAPFPVTEWVPLDTQDAARKEEILDSLINHRHNLFYRQSDAASCYSHAVINGLRALCAIQGIPHDNLNNLPNPNALHKSIPKEYKNFLGMLTTEKGNAIGFMTNKIRELSAQIGLKLRISGVSDSAQQVVQEIKRGNLAITVIPERAHAVLAIRATDDGKLICIDSLSRDLLTTIDVAKISLPGTTVLSPIGSISRKIPKLGVGEMGINVISAEFTDQ